MNQNGVYQRFFLFLLIAADASFLLLHVLHQHFEILADPLLRIDRDRGHAEFFQYVKLYWIVLALGMLAWRTRELVYTAWVCVFGYLLLDDAIQIHERVGRLIAERWHYVPMLGLREADFGELTVAAVIGVLLLGLIIAGYRRSGQHARVASQSLLFFVAALALCGVALDILHQLVGNSAFTVLFVIAEDGGELLVVSATCAYAAGLAVRGGIVTAPVWQTLPMRRPRRSIAGERGRDELAAPPPEAQ